MSVELAAAGKVVGIKQVRRALEQHTAHRVFLAHDADPQLIQPLRLLCSQGNVPLDDSRSMRQLGRDCGIDVAASAAALLRRE